MHHCLNIVIAAVSQPAAVLVRAVEPVAGVEAMRSARVRRARRRMHLGNVPDARLGAGPGRATPRIGIAHATEPWASVPWRFLMAGSASVSGPAASRRAPLPAAAAR